MSAQVREALVELLRDNRWRRDIALDGVASVGEVSDDELADVLLAAGWSRPIPAGGGVEAATEDALARAVMGALQCHVQPVCDGSCNTGLAPCNGQHEERECYEHEDPERIPFTGDVCWLAQSVVDAIRPLLAGGVPGRSEAGIRTEWGWRHDAIGLTVPAVDESEARHEVGRFPRGRTLVCRESTPWRVAGTTEAGDNRG